jgi:cation diffusion facilitator CzcD-associated flavoprotein CzcO
MSQEPDHLDVLIVGAGLSGIDAAYRLQTECRGKSYAVLEARDAIGGTWDLFRYPGVRSDSDIYTLGFPFRPWPGAASLVDGGGIRAYIEDTAREFGIDARIRFGHRVVGAAWSSAEAKWTVEVEAAGERRTFTAGFLYLASGYYDYAAGHRPHWPGEEAFGGQIVHPQHWPEGLDFSGKRVVVIGSGATAVTLVPAMAGTAAHVTMLQRSPSYVASLPSRDPIAALANRLLPVRLAKRLIRLKNVLLAMAVFGFARRWPKQARKALLKAVRKALPKGYDVDRHFTPSYDPWDQRLCLVPDGDLFEAISSGRASVVTDMIEAFTPRGIRLSSGEELEADIVVSATGLVLKMMGGVAVTVDGAAVHAADRLTYKGMMLSGVPNLVLAFGYTNASWTLKCDLTARYVCRLLNHMDAHGFAACTPRLRDPSVEPVPLLDFSSGYIARAAGTLPAQGSKAPWRLHQNYFKDVLALRHGRLDDEAMEFR